MSQQRAEADRADEPDRGRAESDGSTESRASHSAVRSLHRAAGNQALQALHEDSELRPDPAVGRPEAPAEREAERVANRVLRTAPTSAVGSTATQGPGSQEVQRSREAPASDDLTQERCAACAESASRSADAAPTTTDRRTPPAGGALGGGQPLPESVRSFFEPRFGREFGPVRVHTDSSADRAARSVGAEAFTSGRDLVFRDGAYRPGTAEGTRLLAHELTHVVQQSDSGRLSGDRTTNGAGPTVTESADRGTIQRELSPQCKEEWVTGLSSYSLAYPGTLEHISIQQDYLTNINPNAAIELGIPGSGPKSGTGRADIVDMRQRPERYAIYEIKHISAVSKAESELIDYLGAAKEQCDPDAEWVPGQDYPKRGRRIQHHVPGKEIVARLAQPGVIEYWVRNKRDEDPDDEDQPQEQPVEHRLPQRLPLITNLARPLAGKRDQIYRELLRELGKVPQGSQYVILAPPRAFEVLVAQPLEEQFKQKYPGHGAIDPKRSPVHGFRNLMATVISVAAGVSIVVLSATAVGALAAAGGGTVAAGAGSAGAAGGGGATAEVVSLSSYRAAQAVAQSETARKAAQAAGTLFVIGTATEAEGQVTASDIEAVKVAPLSAVDPQETSIGSNVAYAGESMRVIGVASGQE